MATTQKAASPKKSQGFQGIRAAIWVIVVCLIIAVCIYKFLLGNPANFAGNDPAGHPTNLLGTIYKGGIIVPVIQTLLLTVIALSIERWLALRTAFGKGSLAKFVLNVKAAVNKGDFAAAQSICDKQRGSVANVVSASIRFSFKLSRPQSSKRKTSRDKTANENLRSLPHQMQKKRIPLPPRTAKTLVKRKIPRKKSAKAPAIRRDTLLISYAALARVF